MVAMAKDTPGIVEVSEVTPMGRKLASPEAVYRRKMARASRSGRTEKIPPRPKPTDPDEMHRRRCQAMIDGERNRRWFYKQERYKKLVDECSGWRRRMLADYEDGIAKDRSVSSGQSLPNVFSFWWWLLTVKCGWRENEVGPILVRKEKIGGHYHVFQGFDHLWEWWTNLHWEDRLEIMPWRGTQTEKEKIVDSGSVEHLADRTVDPEDEFYGNEVRQTEDGYSVISPDGELLKFGSLSRLSTSGL